MPKEVPGPKKREQIPDIKQLNVPQMGMMIDACIIQMRADNPNSDMRDLLQGTATMFPYHIPRETQLRVAEAALHEQAAVSSEGKKVFVFMNAKTILKACEHFFTKSSEKNEAIVQEGITAALEDLNEQQTAIDTTQIHHAVTRGVSRMIASEEGCTMGTVSAKKHAALRRTIDRQLRHTPQGISEPGIIDRIVAITGLAPSEVKGYIAYRNALIATTGELDVTTETALRRSLRDDMLETIDTIPDSRKKEVILRIYGLHDAPESHKEIATDLGVTEHRVIVTGQDAMGVLRHPSRSNRLRGYIN